MKTLYEAGAASRSEMEQAQTPLSTSEAQLKAVEAQTRQQRVALGYHQVSAPTAGVVGDIPCGSATASRSCLARPSPA